MDGHPEVRQGDQVTKVIKPSTAEPDKLRSYLFCLLIT